MSFLFTLITASDIWEGFLDFEFHSCKVDISFYRGYSTIKVIFLLLFEIFENFLLLYITTYNLNKREIRFVRVKELNERFSLFFSTHSCTGEKLLILSIILDLSNSNISLLLKHLQKISFKITFFRFFTFHINHVVFICDFNINSLTVNLSHFNHVFSVFRIFNILVLNKGLISGFTFMCDKFKGIDRTKFFA